MNKVTVKFNYYRVHNNLTLLQYSFQKFLFFDLKSCNRWDEKCLTPPITKQKIREYFENDENIKKLKIFFKKI